MDSLPADSDNAPNRNSNIELLMDVQLPVSVRFGETEMTLEEITRLGIGSIIELNTSAQDPVDLFVNGRRLAKGEVVTVDGYFGIQITEISSMRERIGSIDE